MCVHTHEGRGAATGHQPGRQHPRQPHPLPVIRRAPSPPSLSPACLTPAPPVTHPGLSPTQPVTCTTCHPPSLSLKPPDRHLGGGQEMGREAHRGVELGAPETLWDPHFCSASCSIAMATSQPQPLSQTSPACPPPGPALSSAEAGKSPSGSRMGQEGGGSSAGWP